MNNLRARLNRCLLSCLLPLILVGQASAAEGLIRNAEMRSSNDVAPSELKLDGDATYGVLVDPLVETVSQGVRLSSAKEDAKASVSTWIREIRPESGRWFRFEISAMAQDQYRVADDGLFLQVEFFKDGGENSLDKIQKQIYAQVQRERDDMADEGTNANLGTGAWHTYSLEFRTPFAEVDSMRLSVCSSGSSGNQNKADFLIDRMQLQSILPPAKYASEPKAKTDAQPSSTLSLIPLGGRWYYDPQDGPQEIPEVFDHQNADQLIYKAGRLETPFAGNMSSWLRAGYLDFDGDEVKEDRFVANNLTILVTDDHLVLRSKNLPNHPTAKFPDSWRFLDGNPSYIKEQRATWHLPLEPKVDDDHVAMDRQNSNQALPMGAIGVACNGVIFFNPFDHILEADATWRLDRCCGHPSPNQQYHYHKYPVCVKSPWTDDGTAHSPVIGFAFDGFPVYGPYESEGELAKDSNANPLNSFNVHHDQQRGWHYHVTPGQYPHIIGGYWGELDMLNRRRGRR